MLKKYLRTLSSFLFWLSPLLFWLFWQIVLLNPHSFFTFIIIAGIIIPFVSYEVANRKFNKYFLSTLADLSIFVASIYFFSSLLKMGWGLQFLWFYFIWHLYRYLLSARNFHQEKKNEFIYFSIYHSLVSIFLLGSLLFGLQSSLSLSVWPLLGIVSPLIFIVIVSLASIQGWLKLQPWFFWLFMTMLVVETMIVLSLLPLNFLVLGVLATLFYYSALNFIRLYLEKRLTKKRITNYAFFTIISLIIIFLTARWL